MFRQAHLTKLIKNKEKLKKNFARKIYLSLSSKDDSFTYYIKSFFNFTSFAHNIQINFLSFPFLHVKAHKSMQKTVKSC